MRKAITLALALVALSLPGFAQFPPDCTGVSDTSLHDGAAISDYEGLLTTVRLVGGLDKPIHMTTAPGDHERLYILEQYGKIQIVQNGQVNAQPFLDITAQVPCCHAEEGLLGMAFHPDFQSNGHFFIYHTKLDGDNVVARYSIQAGNPDLADEPTRVDVLTIAHSIPDLPLRGKSHNAGMLAFSPIDGYLYISVGDGGASCEFGETAQELDSLLGKILRINVDTLPYTTAGNPYDGATPGEDEIWAYGLRNPWRFSFDRITGLMVMGDVGQATHEETNCIPVGSTGGENFGWPIYEGIECPNPSCPGSTTMCTLTDYVPPIDDFVHGGSPNMCAAMGGRVYRGCRMGDLHGTAFWADFCSVEVWSSRIANDCSIGAKLSRKPDLTPIGGWSMNDMTSIAEDQQGELYFVDRLHGEIFKLIPVLSIMEVSGTNAIPLLLHASGWTWEDLRDSSAHPVNAYRSYRSIDAPDGQFECIGQSLSCFAGTCNWAGDPDDPGAGQVHYYLVTAVEFNVAEQTTGGYQTDGTPRDLDTSSPCN